MATTDDISHAIDPTLPRAADLKARWKGRADYGSDELQPIAIRIHRALSWLGRAQTIAAGRDEHSLDEEFVLLWIGLNALYASWDPETDHPSREIPSLRTFLAKMLEIDRAKRIATVLDRSRDLIVPIVNSRWIDHYWWRELGEPDDGDETWSDLPAKAMGALDRADHAYVLDRVVVFRIYTLRCQILHGGATHGGRLNRPQVAACGAMLHRLLDAFLAVAIDAGAAANAGPICYPPSDAPPVDA